jgi:hypothetical protein
MTSDYANQTTASAMAMAHANSLARVRTTFHVCAAPAGLWSPISALTTDRKPGRLRRTSVSTT